MSFTHEPNRKDNPCGSAVMFSPMDLMGRPGSAQTDSRSAHIGPSLDIK